MKPICMKMPLCRMDDLKAKNPDTPDSEVGLFMDGIIDREISEMAAPAPTPRCHFSGYDEIKVPYGFIDNIVHSNSRNN